MRQMDYSDLLEGSDIHDSTSLERARLEEMAEIVAEREHSEEQTREYEAYVDSIREKNRAQRACHKAYQVGKENRRIHCRNLYANYPGCTTLSHIRRNDVRFETVGIEPEMDKSID